MHVPVRPALLKASEQKKRLRLRRECQGKTVVGASPSLPSDGWRRVSKVDFGDRSLVPRNLLLSRRWSYLCPAVTYPVERVHTLTHCPCVAAASDNVTSSFSCCDLLVAATSPLAHLCINSVKMWLLSTLGLFLYVSASSVKCFIRRKHLL